MKEIIDILNRIENKADKLDSRLDEVNITLAKQAKDIEHHIERTDLLQNNLEEVQKESTENTQARKLVVKLSTLFIGILSAISLILGIIYGVIQLTQ